jgi:S1-C subfamily serine protease
MFRTSGVLLLAVSLATLAGPAYGDEKPKPPDLPALEAAFQEAIQKAEPAIACVLVSRSTDPKNQTLDDPNLVPESYGSGIVIDPNGLVLTCYHVVRDATKVYVRLPGGKGAYAEIHAGDPRSDLAVLAVQDKKLLPLKALKLGDGGGVRKGSLVLGLANPYAAGFRDGSPSASWGIISNIRRRVPARLESDAQYKPLAQLGTLLQTDVRLNLGCSGGALIDLKGELIGITSALAAVTGVDTPGGFALPMDDGIKRVIEVLKRGEEVEYGFLGVVFARTTEGARRIDGAVVSRVIPGSPAADPKHGLKGDPAGQKGDTIVAINGIKVQDSDDVFLILGTLLAGSTARVEVVQAPGGKSEVIPFTLAKAYVPGTIVASKKPEAVGGLRVDYASVLYLRPGGDQVFSQRIPKGVMVREVLTGTAADSARLQEGKVIRAVGTPGAPGPPHEVTTPEEFYREIRNAGRTVELVVVNTDGREETVKLDLK